MILGGACARCEKPVTELKSGVACASCGAQFHKRCLMTKGHCNACGVDLAAASKEDVAQREREARRSRARGRTLLWAATLLVIGTQLLSLIVLVATDDEGPSLLGRAIGTGIAVAALTAMHRGNADVAKAMIVVLGMGGLANFFFALASGTVETMVVGGLAGVVLLGCAGSLALSGHFWAHLHHLRGES